MCIRDSLMPHLTNKDIKNLIKVNSIRTLSSNNKTQIHKASLEKSITSKFYRIKEHTYKIFT